MADFDSSLPIRTESAGDVIAKIADSTIPSQQLAVEADGSINVNASFASGTQVEITDGTDTLAINNDGSLNAVVSATDLDIRDLNSATDSVTVLATDLDIRNLVFATDKVDVSGSSVTVSATDLDIRDLNSATDSVTVVATNLDVRDLAFATDKVDVSGSSVTVSATDLDVRDLTHASDSIKIGDGTDFLAVNADGSINVVVSNDIPGTEVCNYQTSTSVAANSSVNHDYTAGTAFTGEQVVASGSGKIRVEVLLNGVTKFVAFNSTASPNVIIPLLRVAKVAAGQVVRITITNLDNQAQNVYSTLMGVEA